MIYAEFSDPEAIVLGAARLHELGYTRLEAYTPFKMPELEHHLGVRRSRLPYAVLAAGISGAVIAYLVIWFANAIDFPLDVGGRPLNSMVTDIPVVFETTVLFAGITAFCLVFALGRMPKLWDPIDEVEGFHRTTLDRYWLAIDPTDPAFVPTVKGEMERCGALAIRELEGAE